MKIYVFLIFILCFLRLDLGLAQSVSASTPTSAKIQGFIISADELERDNESQILYLKGKVKVIYNTQFFEADDVEIHFKKKQAFLKGNVLVQSTNYQIGGKEIILDYEANQALIYYGYVQSNNIRFQGDVIEKQNDTEFYVENADYTTCSNCPPTWSFKGSKIKAELGGYAYIKNSLLKVAGLPAFWLPYLVVPLKSERQSGLLTPEISYSRNRHLVLTQSIFWAISRSQDATFTFKNYELGGLKPMVEHRYALNDDSDGITKFAYLNDKVFASESRYMNYRKPEDRESSYSRWALNSYHQYSPDRSSRFRAQLMLVSDLQYPKDFYEEFTNYSDSALENKFSYTKNTDHSLFSVEAAYYRNLLQADPLAPNTAAVHRLPEIHIDSTTKKIPNLPLYWTFSSNFTSFARDRAYDDISTLNGQRYVTNNLSDPRCENAAIAGCESVYDGVYDPQNDIIRTGNRLLMKATLNTETYNIGNFINIMPKLSYNEMDYFLPVGDKKTASKRYVQFEVSTRTKFFRIYDSDYDKTGVKYKNEIIPEITYSSTPWINKDDHPFFGTAVETPYSSRSIISDKDVNTQGGILFDHDDRIDSQHIISFSLLNRLVRKKRDDNSYKTLVNFRLTQSYDLYHLQYATGNKQPLSDLAATLVLDFDHIQSYTQANYYPYLSATNTLTSLSYLNEDQQYFKIGLSSKRTEEPKQDDISFAIGFVSNYINLLTGVIFDASPNRSSTSRLKKYSLITQLKPPGECWTVNFYREQKVGLEAEWKISFDFSFDGKPTKVIPPAELNIN